MCCACQTRLITNVVFVRRVHDAAPGTGQADRTNPADGGPVVFPGAATEANLATAESTANTSDDDPRVSE